MARDYYAASYGYRFGDPTVVISLVPGKAEEAAEQSAEHERQNGWQDSEEGEHPEGPCGAYGCPWCDVSWSCESLVPGKNLFSAAELKENRHALRRGEVVFLDR
jgi:hypothetical protein